MRDDDAPLAQFAVAFNGVSWTDPDSVALMVMQAMLGSWNKSTGAGKHMGLVFFSLFFVPFETTCNGDGHCGRSEAPHKQPRYISNPNLPPRPHQFNLF